MAGTPKVARQTKEETRGKSKSIFELKNSNVHGGIYTKTKKLKQNKGNPLNGERSRG